MALLYTNLGLKKGSPLLPQHQAHVGSKPSPSHGPSRSTIGPKGPQRQARTPSPSGVPLVAMSWSPWCPISLILPGGVLTWCLRVWQSSFFSNPSPPDVPPLLPPGVLSPLSSAITASPTRLRGCPPPQVPLGGLPSSPSRDLPKFCCCTAPSSLWSWDPSRAQQRGKDTLQGVPS